MPFFGLRLEGSGEIVSVAQDREDLIDEWLVIADEVSTMEDIPLDQALDSFTIVTIPFKVDWDTYLEGAV